MASGHLTHPSWDSDSKRGTTDGTTAVTDYSTLPEGIWSGDVSVQFDATWTS